MDTNDSLGVRVKCRDRYGRASLLSKVLWCWLEPIFITGCRKKHLHQEDLCDVPNHARSEKILSTFHKYWLQELEGNRNPRLWMAVVKLLWLKVFFYGILSCVEVFLVSGQAIMVGLLADYFAGEITDESTRNAILYALGIATLALSVAFVHSHGYLQGQDAGMMARIALTGIVYKKIFSLSLGTISEATIGKIITLASYDVQRVEKVFYFAPFVVTGPLNIIVVLVILWVYLGLGPSSLAGVGVIVLFIPLSFGLGLLFAKLRAASSKLTDERVKVMHEIVSGIRVIKMYGWEHAFRKLITKLRKKESRMILYSDLIHGIFYPIKLALNGVVFVLMFTAFVLSSGQPLTPSIVFTSIVLVGSLRITITGTMNEALLGLQETKVALSRIQELLLKDLTKDSAGELYTNNEVALFNMDSDVSRTSLSTGEKPCVVVNNISASWKSGQHTQLTLSNVSFTCNSNKRMLAIVGPVGAGKSSILHCLLGELQPLNGSIEIAGTLGYSSQDPWVFSGTVKDNILFGREFDEEWFNQILEECCLKEDISLLPHSDLTLVGERGVTLSGGQKARITLARALYRKADVYILDDPLSAVDAVVGRRLFQTCMSGVLKNSIVVLVTHHLQYAQLADAVLVLDQGEPLAYGCYDEIMKMVNSSDESAKCARLKGVLNELLSAEETETETETMEIVFDDSSISPKDDKYSADTTEDHVGLSTQMDSIPFNRFMKNNRKQSGNTASPSSNAVPLEDKVHGSVTIKTYYQYFMAGGGYIGCLLTITAFLLAEVAITLADWWPSEWAESNSTCSMENATHYICNLSTEAIVGIYFGIVSGSVALSLLRAFLFFCVSIHAAQVLHNRMFASVLRATVRFFDTNPIGRVVNRFSKDLGFLDDVLPFFFFDYLSLLLRVISIIVLAGVANYYMFIVVAIVACTFLLIRWYYLTTVREVKRLEAIARSPLFSHITATLQGLTTIRACGRQDASMEYFHAYQDEQTKGWSIYIHSTRWLGLRVDFVSTLFIILVMFLAIPLANSVDAGLIGLSITYSISLTSWCQYGIRSSGEVESLMISAERLIGYSHLPSEPPLELAGEKRPPSSWPSCGSIQFCQVNFRYSDDTPYVLKDISVDIKAGEKIAIVGRTGAGKSSLLQALFRMTEPEGLIMIDGISITDVGLHELRQRMSIIPQDPVLFSGSVRYNLDPFSEYSDEEIWTTLEQVELKKTVQEMKSQLESTVTEGGSNFSVGQRQLMCLGRALLRKNKILVIDEATANVDMMTDAIIQQTIRREFANCTTLIIAHRLHTVMDADRIMVLSAGRVSEIDSPYHLLSNPHSLLCHMVEQAGESVAEQLKKVAAEAHYSKQDSLMW